MAEKDKEATIWGYRKGADGEIEARQFPGTKLPTGWKDVPPKKKES